MKQRTQRAPKLVYQTPFRECAHADRGCCPPCEDPMKHLGTQFRRIVFSTPRRRAVVVR
jgi:hypothetical protein